MMHQTTLYGGLLTVLTVCASISNAAPEQHHQRSGDAICGVGIYGELVPFLDKYNVAVDFCSAFFPVHCTTQVKVHKRAPGNTLAPPSTTTAAGPTTTDRTKSAWSKCRTQPWNVISTVCSCIETAKVSLFAQASVSFL